MFPGHTARSRVGQLEVRVRCLRLFKTAGPDCGAPVDEHPHLHVGDEFVVLSVLIDDSISRVLITDESRGET
jgi:hypothetical protein